MADAYRLSVTTMPTETIRRILSARVYDVAIETPIHDAPNLSRRFGNRVLLKREDLQPIFSFKIRGAYNKIASLPAEQRGRGVICASAGNHGQGVAIAGKHLDIKTTVVMPKTTPAIKTQAVARHGANVILYGDNFDAARAHSAEIAEIENLTYIHPYDDLDVIAGQGTVGAEILRQHQGELHAVFVPVGGGGLIAGVGTYIKYLRPDVKIIGVEPEDAACMAAALEAGERVVLDHVGLFADGVAVAQVGEEPFRLARECVDEVITVSVDEMCAAIKDVFEDTRSIAEPAGALAIAGLKAYVERTGARDQTLIAIDSGANTNFDRLRYVSERADYGEKTEAILAVTIPERPGAFRTFCGIIGPRAVTEFNYRFGDPDKAVVYVGLRISADTGYQAAVVHDLRAADYPVVDLTHDELAKEHVRHMVGGKSDAVSSELLYRFEFPERPGALLDFLNALSDRWNISMFHYRNHGSAFGNVLVGAQVPLEQRDAYVQSLHATGYAFVEETNNAAYRLFLR